jgi:acetyltransferase-like isoleucine patch superfamily enzyme
MGRGGDVRVFPAVHARRPIEPDAAFEIALAEHLRAGSTVAEIESFYDRFAQDHGDLAARMRRAILRALVASLGDGARIGRSVSFLHAHTFVIGPGCFVGDPAVLQGRHDGRCTIGERVWIGPQAYLDARDLTIGDRVGIGPGARVLGAEHTGEPIELPVIETEQESRPVRIESGSDIGTGAVILPGVTIGRGAIVGAGAVVTRDVPALAIVVGSPARVLRSRGERAKRSTRERKSGL